MKPCPPPNSQAVAGALYCSKDYKTQSQNSRWPTVWLLSCQEEPASTWPGKGEGSVSHRGLQVRTARAKAWSHRLVCGEGQGWLDDPTVVRSTGVPGGADQRIKQEGKPHAMGLCVKGMQEHTGTGTNTNTVTVPSDLASTFNPLPPFWFLQKSLSRHHLCLSTWLLPMWLFHSNPSMCFRADWVFILQSSDMSHSTEVEREEQPASPKTKEFTGRGSTQVCLTLSSFSTPAAIRPKPLWLEQAAGDLVARLGPQARSLQGRWRLRRRLVVCCHPVAVSSIFPKMKPLFFLQVPPVLSSRPSTRADRHPPPLHRSLLNPTSPHWGLHFLLHHWWISSLQAGSEPQEPVRHHRVILAEGSDGTQTYLHSFAQPCATGSSQGFWLLDFCLLSQLLLGLLQTIFLLLRDKN